MLSFVTSAQGAFKTAMAAGAVTLTLAGASLGTAEPAAAFGHGGGFHHVGGFHGGGFRHGGGFGRRLGGFRVVHRGFGFRRYGYGVRRFAYGRGIPYGVRRCIVGSRFVPGFGCRRVGVYGTFGHRPLRPLVRVIRPFGFGTHRFAYVHGRRFGGFGFRHAGGFARPFGGHRIAFGGHHGFGGGHGFRRH